MECSADPSALRNRYLLHIRLKFVQIREFKQGLKQVFGGIGKKHEKKEGEMTSFQSVATAIEPR